MANILIVVFSVAGNVLCIYKKRSNFTIGGMGVLPSMYLAIYYHNWGSVFSGVLAIIFCIWGWVEWGNK